MSSDRKKILVTGASGQLGQALQDCYQEYPALDFIFADRATLDITDEQWMSQYLDVHQPDIIINTAAYTAVDKAENDENTAYLVNEKGAHHLALACKSRNILFVHISTDYVFDGESNVPYKETDMVNPQTVYGQSKLAGERAIQEVAPGHFYIVRTSWLYSTNGHNFYNTMLRLAKEGKEISVVNDQWGSPTRADYLAKAIIIIALNGDSATSGIYHYAGEGKCTWYAFAKAILEKNYPNQHHIKPVSTKEYPTPARRPRNSMLNTSLIQNTFGIKISDWKSVIL